MAKLGGAQESMIPKLRRKLFFTHVAFAAIALLVLGVVIVYVDYQQQEQAVYDALSRSLELDARQGDAAFGGVGDVAAGQYAESSGMPALPQDEGSSPEASDGDADSQSSADVEVADDDGFVIEERTDGATQEQERAVPIRESVSDQFVAVSVYDVDSSHVARVRFDALGLDSETAQDALRAVMVRTSALGDMGEGQGKIASLGLYYRMTMLSDGSMKVAFASENYVNQTMRPLLRSLLIAGSVALVGFVTISVLLVRWSVRPVETAWRQQQQFVADASHELKTPLAVILANNSLIMADPQASVASQMQWVESTETEAHLMQDLVNDMLFLAKSEFEQIEEECGLVDFSDIVQASVLQFESVAFERCVMIQDDIASDVLVRGHAARLQRLVGTLVDNACKYADENGLVKVELSNLGQTCRLVVSNTGPAVDPEDLPHLFDRFYRSDKARTRGTGGFGLGLAIAKGVVDDLGGTISATSSEGEGTTFTVTLPIGS